MHHLEQGEDSTRTSKMPSSQTSTTFLKFYNQTNSESIPFGAEG